jgi:hypothetical protein
MKERDHQEEVKRIFSQENPKTKIERQEQIEQIT